MVCLEDVHHVMEEDAEDAPKENPPLGGKDGADTPPGGSGGSHNGSSDDKEMTDNEEGMDKVDEDNPEESRD